MCSSSVTLSKPHAVVNGMRLIGKDVCLFKLLDTATLPPTRHTHGTVFFSLERPKDWSLVLFLNLCFKWVSFKLKESFWLLNYPLSDGSMYINFVVHKDTRIFHIITLRLCIEGTLETQECCIWTWDPSPTYLRCIRKCFKVWKKLRKPKYFWSQIFKIKYIYFGLRRWFNKSTCCSFRG